VERDQVCDAVVAVDALCSVDLELLPQPARKAAR